MLDRRVTFADVAREAKVHPTTVSMAMRNHPRLPLETRQRIQEIAKDMGYRPDPAVQALVAYRRRVKASRMPSTIAYVTTDARHETPLATGYRVLDTQPFGLKRLKAYLRERDVGRLTIKKRGTAVVPEQLRAQLDLRGSAEATIVLTRAAGRQVVLLVDPI